MKHKKDKKNNQVELSSYSIIENLIPIIIFVIFLVIAGVAIIRISESSKSIDTEYDPWKEAYKSVESSLVGVQFDDITTTEDIFTKLSDKCNTYIKTLGVQGTDTNVNVNTSISEKTFIDGNANLVHSSSNDLVETGPIYFQNMLITRYINANGQLKLIGAVYNKSDISIVQLDDIKNNIKELKDIKKTTDKNYMSEDLYLYNLSCTVVKMLNAGTSSEEDESEKEAINYFTAEGKNSVFDCKKTLEGLSRLQLVCIEGGKSSTSISSKNRVFMQVKSESSTEIYNIILKLNDNNRIFDIDLV